MANHRHDDPGRRFRSGSTVPQSDRGTGVGYLHGGGLVMGTNHSFEPLARALAGLGRHRRFRRVPAGAESPPPAQFDDAYAATEWVSRNADDWASMPADSRWSATAQEGRLLRRWRWPHVTAAGRRSAPGVALPWPGSRHDGSVDHSVAMRRCSAATTSITCTPSPTAAARAADPYRVPAYASDLWAAVGHRRDRGMRPDSGLG